MITQTMEDYLKTVYALQHRRKVVTTTQIAERLGVTAASVTGMVKKLAARRLVTYRPYHGVSLTRTGRKVALEVLRHHRLLELYLNRIMGIPWDKVHAEADRLEHVISEDLEQRIDTLLGQPRRDPHGAPIPALDGRIDQPATTTLADLQPGQSAIVEEVSDHNPELLQYLGSCGLFPGTAFKIVNVAPYEGPVTIAVANVEHVIGRKAAGEVYVLLDSDKDTN